MQVYEGICIGIRGKGLGRTCMVRKISYGIGVERVFPVHSPKIARIEVVRRGRRATCQALLPARPRGQAAKVKELIGSKR